MLWYGARPALSCILFISHSVRPRYTSDNGPHPTTPTTGPRDRSPDPAYAATRGLRQCKASLYEGGIRVPGLLEWPAVIRRNVQTWHPAYVSDYLPTFLDVLGRTHPQPTWAADGMSLLPLVTSLGATGASNDTSSRPPSHPLVFSLKGQAALIDNSWKILSNPQSGLCATQPGTVSSGVHLYDLDADPTESLDVSADPANAARFKNMSAQLTAFTASLVVSARTESKCAAPVDDAPLSLSLPVQAVPSQCSTPFGPHRPPLPPPPSPAPPSGPGFQLQAPGGGGCLTAKRPAEQSNVSLLPCAPGSNSSLQEWQASDDGKLFLAHTDLCVKPREHTCTEGDTLWLGTDCEDPHGLTFAHGALHLVLGCTPSLCVTSGLVTESCASPTTAGWSSRPLDT